MLVNNARYDAIQLIVSHVLHRIAIGDAQHWRRIGARADRLQIASELQRRGALLEWIWHRGGRQQRSQLRVIHKSVLIVAARQRRGYLLWEIAER